MTLRSVPNPDRLDIGERRLAKARELLEDPDERAIGGGFDQHTLSDATAREDYLFGALVELRTQHECQRYGVRPKPSERAAIQHRIAAEEWDAACQFEHMSVEVDRRRELARRCER